MRPITRTLTLGLLLATAAPAIAQLPLELPPPPLPDANPILPGVPWSDASTRVAEEFRARLNRAANHRRSRNCAGWAAEIEGARSDAFRYEMATSEIRPPGGMRDHAGLMLRAVARFYRPLIDQEAARPCPPDAAPPAPPTAERIGPPTTPDTPPGGVDAPPGSVLDEMEEGPEVWGVATATANPPPPSPPPPPQPPASPPPTPPANATDFRRSISPPGSVSNPLPITPEQAEQNRVRAQQADIVRYEQQVEAAERQVRERASLTDQQVDAVEDLAELLRTLGAREILPRVTAYELATRAAAAATALRDRNYGRQAFRILHAEGGVGQTETPPANYGVRRDGAAGTSPDVPAAYSTERADTFGFGFGVDIGGIAVSLGYAEGDARNRTEIAPSTTGGGQGTVNTALSPGGSTGGFANRGLTVDTNTEVKEFSGSVRFDMWTIAGDREFSPVQGPLRNPRLSAEMFGELFINYRERDHFGEVNIPGVPAGTPPVINQVIENDVDETEIGAALGVETRVPLGSNAQFTFGVDLGLYYFDHGVDTLQTNVQLVGGPQDLAFTLTQQDSESGIGVRGDASAELAFAVSSALELFARGGVSFTSDRAQVVNPFSGNFVLAGGTTFLDSDDTFDWAVRMGVRIALGRTRRNPGY